MIDLLYFFMSSLLFHLSITFPLIAICAKATVKEQNINSNRQMRLVICRFFII